MQPSSPPRRPSDCGRQQRECIANNLGRIVNAGYLAVADRLPECGRFHHWRGYADDIDAASPKLGPERFRQIEDETLDPRINGETGLTTQSRSEKRRAGKACISPCRSRGSPYPEKNKKNHPNN